MIELVDVCYSYQGINALDKISLKIDRGEAVAFLGANGSGKSTLMKLINGIILPHSGIYKFDGEELTPKKLADKSTSKAFHQKIGFVFQNPEVQLFCSNVYDEIAFGPRQMGFQPEEVHQRVKECMKLLAIDHLKDRTPYHLSGGEKRKVAFACVLALNPSVLVLDEPMNGLDPKTGRWFAELLLKLNNAGKTIITSTHSLELVQVISKRAVLFGEDHRIAADMPVADILSDIGLLKRVNLVDEYYHKHEGNHIHFHTHNL